MLIEEEILLGSLWSLLSLEAGNMVNFLCTSVNTELGNGAQNIEITVASYSPQLS